MVVIHLFTKKRINENILFSFLKENDMKPLGLWDNDIIETKYDVFVNSKNEFNKGLKSPIGLTYIVEYNSRELTITLFKNSADNYEMKIYLSSLDLDQRVFLSEKLKLLMVQTLLCSPQAKPRQRGFKVV